MDRLKVLDWEDILIHKVVAAGLVGAVFLGTYILIGSNLGMGDLFSGMVAGAGATIIGFLAALVNTAAWPLRERLQRGGTPFNEWSLQKHMEAWVPVGAGWVVYGGLVLWVA